MEQARADERVVSVGEGHEHPTATPAERDLTEVDVEEDPTPVRELEGLATHTAEAHGASYTPCEAEVTVEAGVEDGLDPRRPSSVERDGDPRLLTDETAPDHARDRRRFIMPATS